VNPRPWPHVPMIVLLALLLPLPSWGGPPFRTDDPETVDYQHFEMASGIEYENDRGTLFGTAPHFDMNYGVAPNVQAHLMVSDDYVRNTGQKHLSCISAISPLCQGHSACQKSSL